MEVSDPQGCIATDLKAAERKKGSESGDAVAAQGATVE